MTKTLMSMALTALLAGTAYVATAQQEQPAQQEAPSADDAFARLDSDRDGKLSDTEFAQAFGGQAGDAESKKQFSEWDADGNGSISKQEFAAKYTPSR